MTAPTTPTPVVAVTREALVNYAMHYGPRCRECADNDDICPLSGMACGERRKATEFVVDALIYGATHGYCPARLAASTPASGSGVAVTRDQTSTGEICNCGLSKHGPGDHHPLCWFKGGGRASDIIAKLYADMAASPVADVCVIDRAQLDALALASGEAARG